VGVLEATWVREFTERNGRPPRVLHVGNIANNAYINAKIQRRYGVEADVVAFDYYHIMGNPEWEDATFSGDVDEFFPDWWSVGLGDWERPSWFVQGPQRTCIAYLVARTAQDVKAMRSSWRRLRLERWLLTRSTRWATFVRVAFLATRATYAPRSARAMAMQMLSTGRIPGPSWVLEALARIERLLRLLPRKLRGLWRAVHASANGTPLREALAIHLMPTRLRRYAPANASGRPVAVTATDAIAERALPWIEQFRQFFPERADQLSVDDTAPWFELGTMWREVFVGYDVVQMYATYPAMALAAGIPSWTAYEHGTLRDIPFADDPVGRITALGYRLAPTVFVTNADDLDAAARLGIEQARTVALPHAVDSDKIFSFSERHPHRKRPAGERVHFFAPARHDWADPLSTGQKGNDRVVEALRLLRDEGLAPVVMFVDWGRDAVKTKQLIDELEVVESVAWTPPLRKADLWRAYLDADAVIDQFVMGVMGSVTFEALGLGRRVISALDTDINVRFFGEAPPLLAARSAAEIADAMRLVVEDPQDAGGRGVAARDWFERYHSSERIVDLQLETYERLVRAAAT